MENSEVASGLKHLITCRCVMSQFKNRPDPPRHQFTVFSSMNDDSTVNVKFSQCNNCGVVHKVVDICRSVIVNREEMGSIMTVDELRPSLPANLASILDSNRADLPTWEMASFILENKRWGDFLVLSTDEVDGTRQGKYVRIMGENMFKVESFTREEVTG
jgi:hypothetical protein